MKALLINYQQYNHWANEKMCKYLDGVDELGLASDEREKFETIKSIILHIANTEQIWLGRLSGKNIPNMYNLDTSKSFSDICTSIRKNSDEFITFLSGKEDNFFLSSTEYVNLKGKTFSQNNAEIILHSMNHSTFHRGQVMSMLRNVGYTDQSASDFIMFLREKRT